MRTIWLLSEHEQLACEHDLFSKKTDLRTNVILPYSGIDISDKKSGDPLPTQEIVYPGLI